VRPRCKRGRAARREGDPYDGDVAQGRAHDLRQPADSVAIGAFQVEWIGAQIGYKARIAILSATPTAANQNTVDQVHEGHAEEAEVQEP
jgi:rhamnose transport system substrate-binding protein